MSSTIDSKYEDQINLNLDTSRIMTFDVIRGLAILLMVLFHAVIHTLDISSFVDDQKNVDLSTIPPIFFPVLIIIFILATWDSLFLLISVMVNMVSFHGRLKNGNKLESILMNKIKWGAVLMALGYLFNILFSFDALIINIFSAETASETIRAQVLNFYALQIIGLSLIISSLILYFFYKTQWFTNWRQQITLLLGLLVIMIILSPIITASLEHIFPGLPSKRWTDSKEFALSMILTVFIGTPQPLFPYIITAITGMIFGILIIQPDLKPKFAKFMYSGAGIGFILLALLLFSGNTLSLTFYRPDVTYVIFELSGQLFFIALFYQLIEGREVRSGVFHHLRLWSIYGLSIYMLQAIEIFPRTLILLIFGQKLTVQPLYSIPIALLVTISVYFMWTQIIKLWNGGAYHYTVEHFISEVFGFNITSRLSLVNLDESIMESSSSSN